MIKENIKSCQTITRSVTNILREKGMENATCLFPMLRKEEEKLLLGTLIEIQDEELWNRDKVTRPKYWVLLDMNDFSLVELNDTSKKDYMDPNIIPLDKEYDDEFKLESKNVSKFALDKGVRYKEYLMQDIKDEVIHNQKKMLVAINNKLIVDNNIIDAKGYLIANVEEEIDKKVTEIVDLICNEKYSALIYYYQTLIAEIMKEYMTEKTINTEKMKLAANLLDAYYGEVYGIKYFFKL